MKSPRIYKLTKSDVEHLKFLDSFGYSWNHENEMDGIVRMGLANEDNLNGKVTLSSEGKIVLEELDEYE